MNRLSIAARAEIVGRLVEANSLRAVTRITGRSINTVTKLLVAVGTACAEYHDTHVHGLKSRRVKCDEIWAFMGGKKMNTTSDVRRDGFGDAWTWIALDVDSRLCISYLVGGRDSRWAFDFMVDVARRVRGRMQLTTDGHRPYLEAVEGGFGFDADFATLQKIYGAPTEDEIGCSGPARCVGSNIKTVISNPDPEHVSISFVERQNLAMRKSVRRFARLPDAFSRRLENHSHAVSLHFLHYNFASFHKTLRVTPAMEAGIASNVWSLEDIASLPDRLAAAVA